MGLLIGILVVLGYGLFFIVWPEKAREQFLRPYKLDTPIRWYKPNTWLRLRPSLLFFRIVGATAICLGILVLYLWRLSP